MKPSVRAQTAVDPDQPAFRAVIDQYFGGVDDGATTSRLSG